MHTSPTRVAIVFVLSLFAHASVAIDAKGKYNTRGIGSNEGSCGDYTTTDIATKRWYEHWLLGYVSGVNRHRPGKSDFTNKTAVAGLLQWMENYCKENPLASYSEAADALLQELQKRR